MPKKTQKALKGLKTAVMALFAKNSTPGIKKSNLLYKRRFLAN